MNEEEEVSTKNPETFECMRELRCVRKNTFPTTINARLCRSPKAIQSFIVK